jgi:DNA-binding GntR family transcriptional regulator
MSPTSHEIAREPAEKVPTATKRGRRLPLVAPSKPGRARDTLRLRVYRALARGLMGGMFTPGEAVSLRTLAARLGTSAMPVREAVSRLIAERALVMLPNRSVIIPRMTRERFVELTRIRQKLEGMLTELACIKATAADVGNLVRINDDLRRCLATDDFRGAMTGNMTFHFALYELAGSEVTLPLVETLWLQAGPFVALSARLPNMRWSLRHHGRLLAAFRAGDHTAARRAIEDDIEESLQQLLKKASFAEPRQSDRRKPRPRRRDS